MCKVCLKSAEHTIFIIDLHHILHEIQLKIKVAKTHKKKLQPIMQMQPTHTMAQ